MSWWAASWTARLQKSAMYARFRTSWSGKATLRDALQIMNGALMGGNDRLKNRDQWIIAGELSVDLTDGAPASGPGLSTSGRQASTSIAAPRPCHRGDLHTSGVVARRAAASIASSARCAACSTWALRRKWRSDRSESGDPGAGRRCDRLGAAKATGWSQTAASLRRPASWRPASLKSDRLSASWVLAQSVR